MLIFFLKKSGNRSRDCVGKGCKLRRREDVKRYDGGAFDSVTARGCQGLRGRGTVMAGLSTAGVAEASSAVVLKRRRRQCRRVSVGPW
ncbi:unnamed protein product [Cuscuta campestris]|uniref:Uncharacterized protein n=1 Tax=Cuscuta campestris TaxID=132261 RepID=A0A484M564_9ASTE|nr:unnamed protein product [Cuscuta campestris]